jgi:asparagine synthase (glutamine-hydrolysing)
MCRLAIVDPAGGRQPIEDESGHVWATLNGEIYNFRNLRERLTAAGHRFRTHSDTEVLVHAYEEYGDDLVRHLRGMYAFAIHDERRQRTLLARDRLGKKPLYYALIGGRLIYGSEIKALLASPEVRRDLDPQALRWYFTFKHIPAPHSIFAGVRQLGPAEIVVYDGSALRCMRYWQVRFDGAAVQSHAERDERLIELLREAVRLRVEASDVPVGAFLSGGVDSSLITALMMENSGEPVETFSLGYAQEVPHKSDIGYARLMAAKLGTRHSEYLLSLEDIIRSLPSVVRSFDEPFAGTTSTYWLAQCAAGRVKTVLCGDGADELFGSYAAHRMAAVIQEREGRGATHEYGSFATRQDLVHACEREPVSRWRTRFYAFTDEELEQLLAPDLLATKPAETVLRTSLSGAPVTDLVNTVLQLDTMTLLPDQVLCYADRLSMAHGLEVRSPFLDQEVVEFVATIPGDDKVSLHETKRVLKRVASRFLPREILERRKEGFVLPIDAWLRGSLATMVHEVLAPGEMRHGIFDRKEALRLYEEHRTGQIDHAYKIWTIVMFQLWYRQYVAERAYAPVTSPVSAG